MKHATLVLTLTLALLLGPLAAAGPLDGLDAPKEGRTMRSSSCDPDWVNGNADARPIAPGATLTIAELEGPGRINHLWNTVAASERGYSRLLVIRMYWDGEEQPSVEAPLGDFFVIGNGIDRPFESLPVMVSSDGRARNCYWPMPFQKSARITVTNEGEGPVHSFYYYVDWQKLPSLPEDTPYFHASYRQEYPTVAGRNYRIADIEGKGHYVGTVQSVRIRTASWYGEGDDFFFIDGEQTPSLRGTGSEDYFCDAWGFRQFDGPFYGVPVWEGYDPLCRHTAYRWHITDPVIFEKSLRVEIEHKGAVVDEKGALVSGFEERTDDMASMAFWYQTEPHKAYDPLPPAYDRLFVDWRRAVEAETLIQDDDPAAEGDTFCGAHFQVQAGIQWNGGNQVLWAPPEKGAELALPLVISADGTYGLTLSLTKSWDYGNYQVYLDDKPLGQPVHLQSDTVVAEEFQRVLSNVKAGAHQLRFVNVGKDGASQGYFLGIDAYLVTRLED